MGTPKEPLGVAGVAEVAAGQRLQLRVAHLVPDPQAALTVLDGQIGLALQVVVVDEEGVDTRQALLVAELLGHRLGFLRERQHPLELPRLHSGDHRPSRRSIACSVAARPSGRRASAFTACSPHDTGGRLLESILVPWCTATFLSGRSCLTSPAPSDTMATR